MKPRILISTASKHRTTGLLRVDAVGGVNYAEVILEAGGLPFFLPNVDPDTAAAYVENADGILFSGGEDVDPRHFGQAPDANLGLVSEVRDHFELALYQSAKARGLPILGICRGIQVINIAEGGTLYQHLPSRPETLQHSQRAIDGTLFHALKLEPNSRLARAYGKTTIWTNSYHHQGIDKVGKDLRAVAWAEDGTIEAVEGRSSFVLGLQWHPEMSFARYPEERLAFELFMDEVKRQSDVPDLVQV